MFHPQIFPVFVANDKIDYRGKELYDWLDNELTAIEAEMAPVGEYNSSANFGRADQGSAYILHARLALNSAVYTNGAVKDYQKAVEYSDKVINSGKYALASTPKVNYITTELGTN